MPFQDEDEVTTSDPRPAPNRVEKMLRRIFIEDWSLKLLSLAIAIVLWLLVTGQNQPVTAHVNVQLNFIRPPSLEISNDPPRTVDVMLTGSRNKLDDLTSLDLVATVDISDQRVRRQLTARVGVEFDNRSQGILYVFHRFFDGIAFRNQFRQYRRRDSEAALWLRAQD